MTRMPTVFVSHGAPTFALEPGRAGPLLADLGRRLGKPRAILVLSPHWMTRELTLGLAPRPKTIHDFGGFAEELYELDYPAPGAPDVAHEAAELLKAAGESVSLDPQRGLDHGAWVPLRYMYAQADVPVVPLSMPAKLDTRRAWQLGQALAPLADDGILILGSGGLTHNLLEFQTQQDSGDSAYAQEFVHWARAVLRGNNRSALLDYKSLAPHALRAHPTPEHYLPLPFAAAAAGGREALEILDGGILYGMLSMEAYVFGMPATAQEANPEATPANAANPHAPQ